MVVGFLKFLKRLVIRLVIILAALNGDIGMIMDLKSQGEDLDDEDGWGMTTLHIGKNNKIIDSQCFLVIKGL
jgi:hypothetical protein